MSELIDYLAESQTQILEYLRDHVIMSVLPVALGLALALPLGWWAARRPSLSAFLLSVCGLAYSIPSVAMFVVLPLAFGYQIISYTNVVVALTIYSAALLVRNVIDGLLSVPDDVRLSATALGYGRIRRLCLVELPVSVPVVVSGLRVVTMTNVSMVSVGALVGMGGLGQLFMIGLRSDFMPPIVVGLTLSVMLALVLDALLIVSQRRLTPWARVRAAV